MRVSIETRIIAQEYLSVELGFLLATENRDATFYFLLILYKNGKALFPIDISCIWNSRGTKLETRCRPSKKGRCIPDVII